MKRKILLFLLLPMIAMYANGTIDLTMLFNYENQAIPNYINEDNTPNNNQITDEVATLGRVLFYDKNLSLNNTISCASCHKQEFAFGDDRSQSVGFDGGLTGRHSMRLVNARFGDEDNFFWDERANSLEDQTTQPIQDHIEMGFSGTDGQPDLDSLINKLSSLSYYNNLFEFAFSDSEITEQRMQRAMAQFIRSMQSFDSKFDDGLTLTDNLGDDFPNFTNQENLGKNLYLSNNGAACQRCHSAPEFDINANRDNNGVIGVLSDPDAVDLTNTRAPTLRDMFGPSGTLNGPLMHDASFSTIHEVIDHYNDIPIDPRNTNLDNRLDGNNGNGQNLNLSENEKQALEAFLRTLTGSDIYTNEKWSNPFDTEGNLIILNGTEIVDNDGDGYDSTTDCDDASTNINPGATEIPNNDIDENCDGIIEIIDIDQDGYHSDEDCDDASANVNPAATEIPNNDIDENCDGIIEIIDIDQDGYHSDEDCDDASANVNPAATEIPNNDIDENCDGIIEIIDIDQDGYHSDEDCDDAFANVNPAATEIPNNDIDENCDGIIEIIDIDQDGYHSDEDCDDASANVNPAATEIPNNDIDENCDGIIEIIDIDQDGYNSDEDCNDASANINPAATEIPNNDIDENCDGIIEIIDIDQDGYHSDEDCDDASANVNPTATEIPNNDIDENCDGIIEIIDIDQDGYHSDEDCDDANPNIYPGAQEIAGNDIDEDCDGVDLLTSTDELIEYKLKVYPNPFVDLVRFESDHQLYGEIKVLNIQGAQLITESIENQKTIDLNVQELVAGTYILIFQDQEQSIEKVFKLVKF